MGLRFWGYLSKSYPQILRTRRHYDLAVYHAWTDTGVIDAQRQYHGTFNTAHYLQNGTHHFITADLAHYYRFTVQANSQVDINLTAHLNYGGVNFTLYDINGVQVAASNDTNISNGQTGVASQFLIAGGVYYLVVTEPYTAVGTYDLTITGADANADTDGDGLYDAQEFAHGTDFNKADTDGDGASDYAEVETGANPLIGLHIPAASIQNALTQGTAYPLPFFDKPFNVEHSGSTTWYSLEIGSGRGVAVVLNAHLNYGGLNFTLFDANGVQVAASNDTNISNGQRGVASLEVVAGGTYYIRITEPYDAVGHYGSSAESVGSLGCRQVAKPMIQGYF